MPQVVRAPTCATMEERRGFDAFHAARGGGEERGDVTEEPLSPPSSSTMPRTDSQRFHFSTAHPESTTTGQRESAPQCAEGQQVEAQGSGHAECSADDGGGPPPVEREGWPSLKAVRSQSLSWPEKSQKREKQLQSMAEQQRACGTVRGARVDLALSLPKNVKKRRDRTSCLFSPLCSLCGWFFFCWVTPWMERCRKGAVRPEELPSLSRADATTYWADRMDESLEVEALMSSQVHGRKPSLLRATWRVFWDLFALLFFLSILRDSLSFGNTFFMKRLLEEMDRSDAASQKRGLTIACIIAGVQFVQIFLETHIAFYIARIFMRVETCLLTALFKRMLMKQNATKALTDEPSSDTRQTPNRKGKGKKAQPTSSAFNLMFVDVPSVANLLVTALDMALLPFKLAAAGVMLYSQVGSACVPGMITMMSMTGIVLVLETTSGVLKTPYMKWRDIRLSKTHEVLSEIRPIRMVGWEDVAEARVRFYRDLEMKRRRDRMFLSCAASWINASTSVTATLVTFSAMALSHMASDKSGFQLRASLAIPTVHLLESVLGPMSDFPYTINAFVEGSISLRRLAGYICLDAEKRPMEEGKGSLDVGGMAGSPAQHSLDQMGQAVALHSAAGGSNGNAESSLRPQSEGGVEAAVPEQTASTCDKLDSGHSIGQYARMGHERQLLPWRLIDSNTAVVLNEASFSWGGGGDAAKAVVSASLKVSRGEALILLGPPGCGKTSVICAVLGEMCKLSGIMWVRAMEENCPIGYVPQEAWLSSGTVRDSVIFGLRYDAALYSKVISHCHLEADFARWPQRDSRLLDEGGFGLSGGQRTRLALARALYACLFHQAKATSKNAGPPLLCLDDTFTSLDPRVACTIFWGLFGSRGLLRNAATIVSVDEESLRFFLSESHFAFEGSSVELTDDRQTICLDGERAADGGDSAATTLRVIFMENGRVGRTVDAWNALGLPQTVVTGGHQGHQRRPPASASHPTANSVSSAREAGYPLTTNGDNRQMGSVANSAGVPWTARAGDNPSDVVPDQLEGSGSKGAERPAVVMSHTGGTPSFFPVEVATDEEGRKDLGVDAVDMKERVSSGAVKLSSYGWYLRNAGACLCILSVILLLCIHASDQAADLWIARWTGVKGGLIKGSKHADGLSTTGRELVHSEHPAKKRDDEKEHLWEVKAKLESKKRADQAEGVMPKNDANSPSPKKEPSQNPLLYDNSVHWYYLYIFIGISVGNVVVVLMGYFAATHGSVIAATRIHSRLLSGVLRAPMWFYDHNPLGRIINRLAADQSIIDDGIMKKLGMLLGTFCYCMLTGGILGWISPWLTPLVVVLVALVYFLVFRSFRATCRELQRAILLSFTPLCSLYSEAIGGAEVIRALQKEHLYLDRNVRFVSNCQKTRYLQWASSNWASIRLQLLTFPLTMMSAILPRVLEMTGVGGWFGNNDPFISKEHAGYVGLALSYSLTLAGSIRHLLYQYTMVEKEMCSTERVQEYISMTEAYAEPVTSMEMDFATPQAKRKGPASDPSHFMPLGRTGVEFLDVEIRYRRPTRGVDHPGMGGGVAVGGRQLSAEMGDSELPASISDFSAHAGASEHVGIVGRTGAGKSTLLLSLISLAPASKGSILLDGFRIDCLPKPVMRKLIGVLPQTPILLQGWTVRTFLDPRREFSNKAIWAALCKCGLDELIRFLPGGRGLQTVLLKEESDDGGLLAASVAREAKELRQRRCLKRRQPAVRDDDEEAKPLLSEWDEDDDDDDEDDDVGGGNRRPPVDGKGGGVTVVPEVGAAAHLSSADATDKRSGGCQEDTSRQPLSEKQLRYLSMARLVLNASHYRLILVDEPPCDFSDSTSDAPRDENGNNRAAAAVGGEESESRAAGRGTTEGGGDDGGADGGSGGSAYFNHSSPPVLAPSQEAAAVDVSPRMSAGEGMTERRSAAPSGPASGNGGDSSPPHCNLNFGTSSTAGRRDEREGARGISSTYRFTPIHQLLRTHFPHCTVFVVAHHVVSLRGCDTIWALDKGRFVAKCTPKDIPTQEALALLLQNCRSGVLSRPGPTSHSALRSADLPP